MNWRNIDLKSATERAANILEPYNFETLLLEIETNLPEINEETVEQQFLKS